MKRDGKPGRAWSKQPLPELEVQCFNGLDACRDAWESAGNPKAIQSALAHCTMDGGMPRWLASAVVRLLWNSRRYGRLLARHRSDLTDFDRYAAVLRFRKQGMTFEVAYQAAADVDSRRPVTPFAIEKSYKNVLRRLGAEPWRYAIHPSSSYPDDPPQQE
jgi:hypothetical protein